MRSWLVAGVVQGRHDKIDDTLKPGELSEKASLRAVEQVLMNSFLGGTLCL